MKTKYYLRLAAAKVLFALADLCFWLSDTHARLSRACLRSAQWCFRVSAYLHARGW